MMHVIALWATSSTINIPLSRQVTAAELEWVFVSPTRDVEPVRSNPTDVAVGSRETVLEAEPLTFPITSPLASPDDSTPDHSAGQPTTDWASEIERAAKNAVPDAKSSQRRDFGFPQRAPSTKTPTFDWDRVHTHRVEIVPEGGVIIHLSDKCVMVFMPLPFAFCGIGKKAANGHLLEHMQDGPVAEGPAP